MKRVLMLCYHYPPAQNGGVERSIRFARYLPESDWEPQIISTDLYGKSDQAVHTPELLSLYKRLMGRYPAQNGVSSSVSSNSRSRLVQLVEKYIYIPDKALFWLPFTLPFALCQQKDVIYSSSPPHSVHLLAMLLKWLQRKAWVMDMRDPWTIDPIGNVLRETGWRMRLENWLEAICLRAADAVVLNTPAARDAYQERYPHFTHKFHVITNGYDPDSFGQLDPDIRARWGFTAQDVVICHAGSLARDIGQNQEEMILPLLQAICTVSTEGRARFIFIGRVPAVFISKLAEFGLMDRVLTPGVVSHDEAIRIMQASDMLLLFDPSGDGTTYVRGKLYEYAASQKPVIALVSQGASKHFLENLGAVVFAAPDDAKSIEEAFIQALAGRFLPRNPDFALDQINYRSLTARMAEIFDALYKSER